LRFFSIVYILRKQCYMYSCILCFSFMSTPKKYTTSNFFNFLENIFKKVSKTMQWQEYKWFFFINKTDANEYKSNYHIINLVSLFHSCWLYLSTTCFTSLRSETSQANHKLRYIKISNFLPKLKQISSNYYRHKDLYIKLSFIIR